MTDENSTKPPTEEEIIQGELKRQKLLEEINKSTQEHIADLKEEKKLLEQQKSIAEGMAELVEVNREARKNELKLAAKELKLAQEKLNQLLEERRVKGVLQKAEEKAIEDAIEEKRNAQETLEILQEKNDAIDGFSSKLTNAFSKYTGITGQAETLLGHSFKLTMSTASFSEGLQEALDNIRKMATPTNIIVAGLDTIVQATMRVAIAQDQAVSSFNKLAGTTGEYTDIITDVATSNREFGIGMAEAGQAATALYTKMSSFSDINKETAKSIVNTTAQLDALGVSADITARNMEIATQSLGMTGTQAESLQKELYNTSTALGLPAAALSEGFASTAPQLAKHGTKMVDVLKGLGKSSKETGVSIDRLVSLTANFDTFEGAADAAGKLNAVLGGDLLNSMDLLMATEDERIKLLQDTINNSGKAWHEMNRFEKQAVANAAGITDMTEAAAIFNPRMIGMNKTQKDAAERARAVTTVTKQMEAVFASLAVIITPLLEGFKWILDGLIKINEITVFTAGGIKVGLTTAIIGVIAAVYAMIKVFGRFSKLMNKEKDTPKKLGKSLGDGFKKGAEGISEGVSSIGRGIGTFFTAVAEGVASALTVLTKALVKLGTALAVPKVAGGLAVFAGLLLAIGGAAWMIGEGIGAAAEGMAKFVAAFKDMEPGAILAFGASMLMITAAMYGFVTTAPLAIFAAAGAAVSFGLLALAMSSIGESAKSLTAFNASLTGINFTDVTTGYEKIAEAIEKVAAAINSINPINGLIFSGMMGTQISNNPVATGTPIPNAAGQAGAQRVRTAAETNAVAKVDVVAMTVNETQPRETGNEQVTAKLILKEKEIGELLLSGINNPFDKRTNQIVQTVIKGTA